MATSTTPLALTTIFVPPTSCQTSFWSISTPADTSLLASGFWVYGPPLPATNCYPPAWTSAPGFYFSPGLCPYGYGPASLQISSSASVPVTIEICCPSGYQYVGGGEDGDNNYHNRLPCTSSSTVTGTITVMELLQVVNGTISSASLGTFSPGYGFGFNAYAIQVRFQSTDFQTTNTDGQTLPPSSHSATGSGNQGNSTQHHGLSTGAKAGIGVGVALGVPILALLVGLLLLLRRKSTQLRKLQAQMREPTAADGGLNGQAIGGVSEPDPQLPELKDPQHIHQSASELG